MSKKLVPTSGYGIEGWWRQKGKFEIKASGGNREFSDLSEAVAFYNALHEEAAIWDVTVIPELLELKEFK